MDKREPSARALLDALEDESIAEEADRSAAMSDAEIDGELAQAGVDAHEARARGRAAFERGMRAQMDTERPSSGSHRPPASARGAALRGRDRPRRSLRPNPDRTWAWLSAAAAVAVVVGGSALVIGSRTGGNGSVRAAPSASNAEAQARARELRLKASEACAEARWTACAAALDEARVLDPAGEEESDVLRLRRAVAGAAGPR